MPKILAALGTLHVEPLFCQFHGITREVDQCAFLLSAFNDENCKNAARRRAQFQFFGACFQTERRIYPDGPHQDSAAVTDVSAGSQQTIFEWSVAQGLSVWINLQRQRPGGLSLRGLPCQRLGVSFFPRFERLEIAFQVVEEAHSF